MGDLDNTLFDTRLYTSPDLEEAFSYSVELLVYIRLISELSDLEDFSCIPPN